MARHPISLQAQRLRESYVRSRAKLFTDMLKTGGYASFGTGAFEPVLKHVWSGVTNLVLGGGGVAFLGLALYIAPYGDAHDGS